MTIYRPTYTGSHALVIGINEYKNSDPLQFAKSDAEAVAQKLVNEFRFPDSSVVRLFDAEATRDAIMEAYLALARDGTEPDDRVFVFYAGHGHTITGGRGEIGYLVPHDGSVVRLQSLIRWDELTRNAELIRAKHVFFVMDACYGGLAFRRGLQPGSNRLVKDMLTRYVRQVLTSGKANEQVGDAGGPLPAHSVFTGHLLEGLEGGASMAHGIITANALMAYVYQRVGTDYDSQQTPHFGFLDGDGDFVFSPLTASGPQKKGDDDLFVEVPTVVVPSPSASDEIVAQVKAFIPDPTKAIALDDLVVDQTRKVLGLVGDDRFCVNDKDMSAETVAERLHAYEESTRPLRKALTAIGHWGDVSHRSLAKKVLVRLLENVVPIQGGLQGWLALQYYPSILASYCFGMAAMAAEKYELLQPAIYTPLSSSRTSRSEGPFVVELHKGILEIGRTNIFKLLPDHKRHYAPRSEYMFKLLQPELDDLLFLGHGYENLFDRFEVFLALACADASDRSWGPLGRFCWKYQSDAYGGDRDPFRALVNEAKLHGDGWPPVAAGFFGGSANRFEEVATAFAGVLDALPWY